MEALEDLKSQYLEVKQVIKSLPESPEHEILIPLTKVGFIPGKVKSTNKVWVGMGKDTFVKTPASACESIIDKKLTEIDLEINKVKPPSAPEKSVEEVFNRLKELEQEESAPTINPIQEKKPQEPSPPQPPAKVSKFKQEMMAKRP